MVVQNFKKKIKTVSCDQQDRILARKKIKYYTCRKLAGVNSACINFNQVGLLGIFDCSRRSHEQKPTFRAQDLWLCLTLLIAAAISCPRAAITLICILTAMFEFEVGLMVIPEHWRGTRRKPASATLADSSQIRKITDFPSSRVCLVIKIIGIFIACQRVAAVDGAALPSSREPQRRGALPRPEADPSRTRS